MQYPGGAAPQMYGMSPYQQPVVHQPPPLAPVVPAPTVVSAAPDPFANVGGLVWGGPLPSNTPNTTQTVPRNTGVPQPTVAPNTASSNPFDLF